MKTYEDLLEVGLDEQKRGEFCRDAIELFKTEPSYKEAVAGEAYYNKHNITIENFKKFITTISGRKVENTFSANYKLKTLIFRRFITQISQYMLGNGLKLENGENKAKLGKDFDYKLQLAFKKAMVQGRSFGFWNLDHLEVFGYCETSTQPGFCPLYSEETGELVAGIRFWHRRVGDKVVLRTTLYEPDGYTEYKKVGSDPAQLLEPKRGYIKTVTATEAGGIESVEYSNYNFFPIIPLYANDIHESELNGIR